MDFRSLRVLLTREDGKNQRRILTIDHETTAHITVDMPKGRDDALHFIQFAQSFPSLATWQLSMSLY